MILNNLLSLSLIIQLISGLPIDKRDIVTVTHIVATKVVTVPFGYQEATTSTTSIDFTTGYNNQNDFDTLSTSLQPEDIESKGSTLTDSIESESASTFATNSAATSAILTTMSTREYKQTASYSTAITSSAPLSYSSTLTSSSSPSSTSSSSSTTVVKTIPSMACSDTVSKLWSRFWQSSNSVWNDDDSNCGTNDFSSLILWNQAVVGKAITNEKDTTNIDLTIANINLYKNSNLNVYSASTAGDTDIYTDDNAQISWVFTDAYLITSNEQYLTDAKNIVSFLMDQTDDKGGVIWKYNADYIASISTVEAALAAIKLYSITKDENLLVYTKNCMEYMFKYFQDPDDNFFYDGLDKTNYDDVNEGKLSYTVGCALSTLSYLYKFTGDENWKAKAIELGKAATNQDGAFYNGNKIWNNELKYLHLLFAGFADLFTVGEWDSEYEVFKIEVFRQSLFIYEYLQDPLDANLYFGLVSDGTYDIFEKYSAKFKDSSFSNSTSIYCDNSSQKTKKSLMDNASIAQILYDVSRIPLD